MLGFVSDIVIRVASTAPADGRAVSLGLIRLPAFFKRPIEVDEEGRDAT